MAFGKVRAKFRDMTNEAEAGLNEIYTNVSDAKPLQLFLTDYSSLFVAKVTQVTSSDMSHIAPRYYADKHLDVEKWFVISDLRELVRSDFESIRDSFLANFTTPSYGSHTFTIYGNAYVYPLIVEQKQPINYFENELKHYPDVFKSSEFLAIKDTLIRYNYGKDIINLMHPDSLENIISAEIEYLANIADPLYDLSSVVIKYSKTMEKEIYMFAKELFRYVAKKNPDVMDIKYSIQEKEYSIADIYNNKKPNLGTYKFLFKKRIVTNALMGREIEKYVYKTVPDIISSLQPLRNETVHATPPSHDAVCELREKVLGVGRESILVGLVKFRAEIGRG
ncbi:hypothetical protein CSF_1154 [Campylobacter sputorum bv. faecalis CCUG 20703]|nr:hypothetical protein CSF_1154 [Campylobacter sputorum bv. faecalis CCUG 20703]